MVRVWANLRGASDRGHQCIFGAMRSFDDRAQLQIFQEMNLALCLAGLACVASILVVSEALLLMPVSALLIGGEAGRFALAILWCSHEHCL